MGHTVNINKQRNQMTVTLTANYKETLKAETVELIDELLEDDHDLGCMLEFIDENSEDDFVTYYESYVEQGEKLGYEVVDAFVSEEGFCDVEHCEEAYVGTFRDTDDFVEDLIESTGDVVPSYVIVDLQATWDRSLSYDYTAVEDKSTGMVHFFRRYY
jgi:antirestriction protein